MFDLQGSKIIGIKTIKTVIEGKNAKDIVLRVSDLQGLITETVFEHVVNFCVEAFYFDSLITDVMIVDTKQGRDNPIEEQIVYILLEKDFNEVGIRKQLKDKRFFFKLNINHTCDLFGFCENIKYLQV